MSETVRGALDVPALLASLAEALGKDAVRTDGLQEFAVDGVAPEAAVAPVDEAGVGAVLRLAGEADAAVIPLGGMQHIQLGNLPARYTLALLTSRLNRVAEYEPADLTVTVEAGMTLGELQAQLGQNGQWLPVEAPPQASIGGLLATGAAGPCRHRYGSPRDFLIGVRSVLPDGRAVQSGGRVVKNVAGYDMGKLYTGSLGTLAVITRASFKLAPLPAARALAVLPAATPEAAAALAFEADDRGLALEAVEVADTACAAAAEIDAGSGWHALLRLAGSPAAVERSLSELAELAAGSEIQLLTGEEEQQAWTSYVTPSPAALAIRLSMPPSAVVPVLERLAAELPPPLASLSSSLTSGVVRSRCRELPADAAAVIGRWQAWARREGGGCVVEVAPPAVKQALDVFGPARGDFPLMQRLKDQFDPGRVLSPGRFVGRM